MRPILLFALALLTTGAAAAAGNSFAIRDVRVFDGDKVIAGANVVVHDGRITAAAANAHIPAGLPVVDGAGKTLLPGLIDSHVHVFPGAQKDALRFGVTTELDMFDISRDFKAWRAQRQSLARTDEADTWAAGLGATVAGGAPLEMAPPGFKVATVTSVADAKPFIDARVAEGSDYIKVFLEDLSEYDTPKRMPTLTRAEACAVIAAAHADGKLAIVHAQQESMAREAIDCGADGLAHIFPDRPADAGFVALAKAHHIFVLTTDDIWAGVAGTGLAGKLAADPRVAPFLSAMQKTTLLAKDKRVMPHWFDNALATTRALHEAGVPILAGTDSPNPGSAHGVALHEELQILVRAGFTPVEALHAATALPDEIFHLGRRGRVAPGYRADLLLVNGDPTQHIADTLSIVDIWKNGYAVDRAVH
ncbi:MAG: amidohydrolase family protein [Alphaproteobacteria bacterium]|nr:amidohydrolase family protein [Alphaproteobacteria bacterium]MDE1985464.1 amidohydrolase family protein [Alphaproteobacteria bacterium]MDE2161557.1 amidohydrolase family protein [Alphaproteobacteria bacterium]MDE2266538.1 amidohydrolase family protein [Alphaproteobacteria bacterium]